MIIGKSVRAAWLSTNDHPGISEGKHCFIQQVCFGFVLFCFNTLSIHEDQESNTDLCI